MWLLRWAGPNQPEGESSRKSRFTEEQIIAIGDGKIPNHSAKLSIRSVLQVAERVFDGLAGCLGGVAFE